MKNGSSPRRRLHFDENSSRQEQVKGAFLFVVNRDIVNLYKRYINLVEDLQKDHSQFLKKVEKETSKEFANNIDYFDQEKYNYIRKKILDLGNEGIRDIEKFLNLIDMDFKDK